MTATHHLLGLFDSPYVRRVAITMTHYGIPFEHASLSVFRHMEQMRPLNPLFKVPMLTLPDGEKLYESAYLLDYLDELAAEKMHAVLIPRGGSERRAVLQGIALAMIVIEKSVALVYEWRRPTELVWPSWVDRLRGQLLDALDLIEIQLTGEHLIGTTLTQADITLAVGVGFIRFTIPDEWPTGRYPRIEAHAARMEALPAFLAVPIDKE